MSKKYITLLCFVLGFTGGLAARVKPAKEILETVQSQGVQPADANETEGEDLKGVSTWDKLAGFLGDDCHEIDAKEAEDTLTNSSKVLLADESIVLAYKVGWKRILFTSSRIIFFKTAVVDVWESYMSIPYTSVLAYEVETAGMFPDMDSRVTLYVDIPGTPSFTATFLKGHADVFDIQTLLGEKLLGEKVANDKELKRIRKVPHYNETLITKLQGVWAWLGNDASEVDADVIDKTLRTKELPVLGQDDEVLRAYKIGRDYTLFTSKRVLFIDVKSLSGKKVAYKSVPYTSIIGWSTQRAGAVLDADAELYIYTKIHGSFQYPNDRVSPLIGLNAKYTNGYSIVGWNVFWQDFRKNRADVMDVNALLSTKVLGTSDTTAIDKLGDEIIDAGKWAETKTWFWNHSFWYKNPPTPQAFEKMLRGYNNLILLADEHVEQFYKNVRDSIIFTNKRIMNIDIMSISDRKVRFTSLPYSSIRSFSFEAKTAGVFLTEKEGFTVGARAELKVWTDSYPWRPIISAPNPNGNGNGGKLDDDKKKSKKKSSLLMLNSEELDTDGLDAEMLQETEEDEESMESEQEEGEEEKDQNEEGVATPAPKKKKSDSGSDSGGSQQPTAIAQPGLSYKSYSLSGGYGHSANPRAVQKMLCSHVLAGKTETVETDPEEYTIPPTKDSGWLSNLISGIFQRAQQIDPKDAEKTVNELDHTLLMDDEHVELAYQLKIGARQALTLMTNVRVLIVKITSLKALGMGFSPMEFQSIPYKTIHGFAAETAGKSFWVFGDFDAKFDLYTTTPWMPTVSQNLRKGYANVMEVNTFLTKKTMSQTPSSFIDGAAGWWAHEVDAKDYEKDIPEGILIDGESVNLAYKYWRDTVLFTTHRMLKIDVMMFTGQQRNYKSIPYSSVRAFTVDTAALIDIDSEAGAWTDMPGMRFFGMDVRRGSDPLLIMQQLENMTMA